jgi:tetratricopeptide (TPR) repeat protein
MAKTGTALLFAFLLLLPVPSASSADPADWHELDEKARALIDREEYRQAIPLLHELLNYTAPLDGFTRSRTHNNLGFCHFRLKEYDAALAQYQAALALDPGYLICLNNLAALLIKQGKFRESLPVLEKAFRIDAQAIKILYNFFVVHANLRHEPEAQTFLKLAYERDRSYTRARLMRRFSARQIREIEKRLGVNEQEVAGE